MIILAIWLSFAIGIAAILCGMLAYYIVSWCKSRMADRRLRRIIMSLSPERVAELNQRVSIYCAALPTMRETADGMATVMAYGMAEESKHE